MFLLPCDTYARSTVRDFGQHSMIDHIAVTHQNRNWPNPVKVARVPNEIKRASRCGQLLLAKWSFLPKIEDNSLFKTNAHKRHHGFDFLFDHMPRYTIANRRSSKPDCACVLPLREATRRESKQCLHHPRNAFCIVGAALPTEPRSLIAARCAADRIQINYPSISHIIRYDGKQNPELSDELCDAYKLIERPHACWGLILEFDARFPMMTHCLWYARMVREKITVQFIYGKRYGGNTFYSEMNFKL